MFAAKFMCLLKEVSEGSTNILLMFHMRWGSRKGGPDCFCQNPVRDMWEWLKAVPGEVEAGHQETFLLPRGSDTGTGFLEVNPQSLSESEAFVQCP